MNPRLMKIQKRIEAMESIHSRTPSSLVVLGSNGEVILAHKYVSGKLIAIEEEELNERKNKVHREET